MSQLLNPGTLTPVRFWHDQLFAKPAKHGGVVAWYFLKNVLLESLDQCKELDRFLDRQTDVFYLSEKND